MKDIFRKNLKYLIFIGIAVIVPTVIKIMLDSATTKLLSKDISSNEIYYSIINSTEEETFYITILDNFMKNDTKYYKLILEQMHNEKYNEPIKLRYTLSESDYEQLQIDEEYKVNIKYSVLYLYSSNKDKNDNISYFTYMNSSIDKDFKIYDKTNINEFVKEFIEKTNTTNETLPTMPYSRFEMAVKIGLFNEYEIE